MKRLMFLALPMVVPSAYAEGPMDDFRDALVAIGDQRLTCLDFNGTWTGTCEVTEASSSIRTEALAPRRDVTMTFVQQGCATLQSIEFGMVQIGASKATSAASPRGTSSDQVSVY